MSRPKVARLPPGAESSITKSRGPRPCPVLTETADERIIAGIAAIRIAYTAAAPATIGGVTALSLTN